jgi:aldehyde:ferredoxin oxidoreductase
MTEVGHDGRYEGKALRVDLTSGRVSEEKIEEAILRGYLGGTGLGARYLYDEVPPNVAWNDPENRLILAAGPLSGTRMAGAGSFSVVTKGAMTEGATSSQANGYFGAYLRSSGFDAIVIQGKAKRPVYLYIHDGHGELKDAGHLAGKPTRETEQLIKQELNKKKREASVYSIGPAGEQLVRFACLVGDEGHVAAHNGIGAVAGSKNLKAVAVDRGSGHIDLVDEEQFKLTARQLIEFVKTNPQSKKTYYYGTSHVFEAYGEKGGLPVKNYTTSAFPDYKKFSGEYLRSHFEIKPNPCWACPLRHCHIMKVTEGPYTGYVGEEPDYEQWAAWSSVIGQTDPGAAVVLSNEVDDLGMDTNEAGWLIAWVMECFEKGILTTRDTDGLEVTWGNTEAVRKILKKIAQREGIGDMLAEGVMRASRKVGGKASGMGIYTLKGNTPRGHDHRVTWWELFDTVVSSTGTIESAKMFQREQIGLPGTYDAFSPEDNSTLVAKAKGPMAFEDSLVLCRFATSSNLVLLTRLLNAATGWNVTVEEAMEIGRRIVNLMKVFNVRHGLSSELDAPSLRYGSTPGDGPAAGKNIMLHWNEMLRNYYDHMGWDRETGKPLPETLTSLGLGDIVSDIW